MKVKPLTPPKVEPIITKEVIMQIAFAVKELIQPDIDEIKVRLDKVEKDIAEIKKDIIELKSDVAMLKSFHIKDIEKYKAQNKIN